MDRLHFFCDRCYLPHVYHFLTPSKEALKQPPTPRDTRAIEDKLAHLCKKVPDRSLQSRWGNMEKETLKKCLLQFGYGRWEKIRRYSQSTCRILKDKSDEEMRAFANDFLRTLYDNVQSEKAEKAELRGFIMNVIEES